MASSGKHRKAKGHKAKGLKRPSAEDIAEVRAGRGSAHDRAEVKAAGGLRKLRKKKRRKKRR